jgi:hypothetical protein
MQSNFELINNFKLFLQFDKFKQLSINKLKLVRYKNESIIKVIIDIYNVNSRITISYKNKVYYIKSTGVLGFNNRERRFSYATNMLLKDSIFKLIMLCRKFKVGKINLYFKQKLLDINYSQIQLFKSFSFHLMNWMNLNLKINKMFYLLICMIIKQYLLSKLKTQINKYFKKNLKNNKKISLLFFKFLKFPIYYNKIFFYSKLSFGNGIRSIKRVGLNYWN